MCDTYEACSNFHTLYAVRSHAKTDGITWNPDYIKRITGFFYRNDPKVLYGTLITDTGR
jgi:hypothetical protein